MNFYETIAGAERSGLANLLKAVLAEMAFQCHRATLARYFPELPEIERETWFDGDINEMIEYRFGPY